jgi:hypothetical protein
MLVHELPIAIRYYDFFLVRGSFYFWLCLIEQSKEDVRKWSHKTVLMYCI